VEHSPNHIPISQSVSEIGMQVNQRRGLREQMFALQTADTQTMMMSLPSNAIVRHLFSKWLLLSFVPQTVSGNSSTTRIPYIDVTQE